MKNVFVAGTPFHLLSAFIISQGYFSEDDNYLVLVHPHGFDKWQENPVLAFMMSNKAGYKDVYNFNTWMTSKDKRSFKEQGNYAKNIFGAISPDRMFLGSDVDPQNQMLVAAAGLNSFYRYEDGIYSYYNEDRIRSFSHRVFHKLKIKTMMMMAGIYSNMYINTSTASDSHAGIADFMYLPELLKRYAPKVYEIKKEYIDSAMKKLADAGLLEQQLFDYNYVLYLSQPITEQGKFSFEDEKQCIQEVLSSLDEQSKLIYKPHPNDSPYKLQYVAEHFPNVIVERSKIPVEVMLYREPQIKKIFSYQTTTLILAKRFTGRNIACYSFALRYHKPLHKAYVDIMREVGVEMI